jgi:hypothetical protein
MGCLTGWDVTECLFWGAFHSGSLSLLCHPTGCSVPPFKRFWCLKILNTYFIKATVGNLEKRDRVSKILKASTKKIPPLPSGLPPKRLSQNTWLDRLFYLAFERFRSYAMNADREDCHPIILFNWIKKLDRLITGLWHGFYWMLSRSKDHLIFFSYKIFTTILPILPLIWETVF